MSKQINYTINIDAELGNLESKLNSAKAAVDRLTMDGKHPELVKMFDSIGKSIDNVRKKAAQPINSEAAFGSMHKDVGNITVSIGKLVNTITELATSTDGAVLEFLPPNLINDINKAISAVGQYESAMDKSLQKSKEVNDAEKELTKTEEQLATAQGKRADAETSRNTALVRVQEIQKEIKASDELIAQREKEVAEAEKNYQRLQALYEKGEGGVSKADVDAAGQKVKSSQAEADKETDRNIGLQSELDGAEKVVSGFESEMARLDTTVSKLEIKLDTCRNKV
jgi:DNA repair exonuclease SbcCD ATPase subunit